MTEPRLTVVFDLDGTLVDSARDFVPILNRLLAGDGLAPISYSQVGHVVGQGAAKMIERAFELRNIGLSSDRIKTLIGEFLADYEANTSNETVFYDGVLDCLDEMQRRNWNLAICTNKFRHLAVKLLTEMDVAERFTCITGGDTFDTKKPDPKHLTETVKLSGGDVKNALIVGDSINDILAGQRAEIPQIAVDFGYSDCPVSDLNPSRVISHFRELIPAIQSLK